jgi:phosphohistidine phosphatase SixA
MPFKSTRLHILLSILFLVIGTTARAQNLEGAALVRALERGGYVVVMRHASSPSEPPAKDSADAENTRDERQLDEKGRTTVTAMGKALHDLKIPLGEVLSSPTYRALETVRYAQLGTTWIVARSSRVSYLSTLEAKLRHHKLVDERVNDAAHMIGWHKLIEHHGKQDALITSISSDVPHERLPRFLS